MSKKKRIKELESLLVTSEERTRYFIRACEMHTIQMSDLEKQNILQAQTIFKLKTQKAYKPEPELVKPFEELWTDLEALTYDLKNGNEIKEIVKAILKSRYEKNI